MDSSSVVSCVMSPESTVTSLLSSSGHLRSSLVVPDHNTTFRYRDKDYDSASEALDAYIADFESCRYNRKPLPGRLLVLQRPSCTPSKPRLSTLRNKDVLRERLTERELDFLKLPVSSLYHSVNRDRLSMTTDELLSIPHDGSMPVTHTSAFLQGLLNQSGASQPCLNSSALAHKNRDRLSSANNTVPTPNQYRPHPGSSPRIIRRRHRAATLKPEVDFSSVSCNQSSHWAPGLERAELTTSIHPPHWFTSNKSGMDCSVLRDLKYPAWVSRCDLSEPPPPTELEPWEEQGFLPSAAPKTGAPSWVAELEDSLEQTHVDSQQTLRDLRLQFAEQISLLATERKNSHIIETLFRDNRIESLIQKADQVLNSLSRRSGGENCCADSAETRTQPRTQVCRTDCGKEAITPLDREESQLYSSSHCHPDTLESGATAEGVSEVLIDNGAQEGNAAKQGRSITKQPGPAEALKQMLFRLQAVEAELHRQQLSFVASTATDRLHAEEYPMKRRPEAGEELESSPGGPSLQRALHHLGRLKQLVEEPREKHGEEGKEEKDEDEGHYSSSSSERLLCIQEKSSS